MPYGYAKIAIHNPATDNYYNVVDIALTNDSTAQPGQKTLTFSVVPG